MISWTGVVLCATAGLAAPRFVVSELRPSFEIEGYWVASLDADSRPDFLVSGSDPRGRSLTIYRQNSEGRFSSTDSRTIRLKKDIIAFSLLELRTEPGVDLLFFTRSSAFSFDSARESFARNAKRVWSGEFLFDIPDDEKVLHWAGEGAANEFLVPTLRSYEVVRVRNDASFEVIGRLPVGDSRGDSEQRKTERRRRIREQRRGGDFSIQIGGRTDDALPDRGLLSGNGSSILKSETWLPSAHFARLDGDARDDLVVLASSDESRRVRVHLQRANGKFLESEDFEGELEGKGPVWLLDYDGDGVSEIVVGDPRGRGEQRFRFYENTGSRFDFSKPALVLKFEGYGVTPSLADLDGDGKVEFVVVKYSISKLDALRGGKVQRDVLVYTPDGKGAFRRRPSAVYRESFDAGGFRGLGSRVRFDVEISAVGRRDLTLVERDGSISARRFEGRAFSAEPFWSYLPSRRIREYRVLPLGSNERSGIVLEHESSLSVIVFQ